MDDPEQQQQQQQQQRQRHEQPRPLLQRIGDKILPQKNIEKSDKRKRDPKRRNHATNRGYATMAAKAAINSTGGSSSSEQSRGTRETNRQDQNNDSRQTTRLLQGDVNVEPVETAGFDESSGSPQDSERWRKEGSRCGSDNPTTVLSRIYDRLLGVVIKSPVAYFKKDDYHFSPAAVEMVVRDLIREFESTSLQTCKLEEALETNTNECTSLKTANAQLIRKNEDIIRRASQDRVALEQEYDRRASRMQNNHENEKKDMVKVHLHKKESLEHDIKLLEEYRGDTTAIIESETNKRMAKMKVEFEHRIHQSQESLRATTEHYEKRLEKLHRQCEEEKHQMLGDFNIEKSQMIRDSYDDKRHMEREFQDDKDYYEGLVEQYEEEKQKMKRELYDEMAKLSSATELQKHTFETQLNNLRIESENTKQRMIEEHHVEIMEIFEDERASMGNRLQELEDSHHEKIHTMQGQHTQELDKKDREIEEVKKQQEAKEKRLEEQHAAEKLKLEKEKVDENRKLRGDFEALKGAVVKRDPFKAMSDRDLAFGFQDLVNEIEAFSRAPWDTKLEATWPFSGQVLRKLENERRSKKHVIQNTIWVIFYERIFCTPFQVLGTEGVLIEQDWIKEYGQDLKSPMALPKPTKDSEKWRYEKISDCLKAINQPSNPKRLSYERWLSDTVEDVSHELKRVASMKDDDKQRIRDLVRKGAKMWLEIGLQRYRIFLLMSKTGIKPSRSGQAFVDRYGEQELVVHPEVRRRGNAQGDRLEKDEPVTDCQGKFDLINAAR